MQIKAYMGAKFNPLKKLLEPLIAKEGTIPPPTLHIDDRGIVQKATQGTHVCGLFECACLLGTLLDVLILHINLHHTAIHSML